ncbi:hypothetical protein GGX14DRAFT_398040 [Mycena pura]|uniref:Uncharacterized protein n=1 Tax=Mycena pura TaxID=153505 RepID=A0AAD6VE97_9AGAR|nr:hypothetical protein GGX14DRAFT_398040 [Mycena pura]
MNEKDYLNCVVPTAGMMLPLIRCVEEKYKNTILNPAIKEQRDWMLKVHPAVTSSLLPTVIHSEKDTEDWVLNVIWRPAAAALCVGEARTYKNKIGAFPNMTSCSGGGAGAAIPDAMLWSSETVYDALLEIKTHAAFIDTTSSSDSKTFDHLWTWPDMPPGYGIRFVWGETGETGGDKADKMIAQVWVQMVKHNINYAALTNYNSVIFFIRRDQTLYLSREYLRVEYPIKAPEAKVNTMSIAVFAFIAYVTGSIPKDTLTLPQLRENWWTEIKAGTAETPGLDRTSIFKAASGEPNPAKSASRTPHILT